MGDFEKKPCECGMQSMGHGCCRGKHHLIKMILKIFIIILIFWCGFTLGKMIGLIKGGHGYGMYSGFEMKEGCKNLNTVPTATDSAK